MKAVVVIYKNPKFEKKRSNMFSKRHDLPKVVQKNMKKNIPTTGFEVTHRRSSKIDVNCCKIKGFKMY
jgi:hypothetical protein